jgi:hypothetical protein
MIPRIGGSFRACHLADPNCNHYELQYIFLNPVRAKLIEDWWNDEWLGTPLLGDVGPDFFGYAPPEDILWCELLSGGP